MYKLVYYVRHILKNKYTDLNKSQTWFALEIHARGWEIRSRPGLL